MDNIKSVNHKTLKHYHNRTDGNIYWYNLDTGLWEVVDGFTIDDYRQAISNGIKFIFVPGIEVHAFSYDIF